MIGQQAADAAESGQAAASGAAKDPASADAEFNSLLSRVFDRTSETASAADREALVNVLAARTNKSRKEASEIVSRWEQTYQQAKSELQRLGAQAEQQAREMGDAAAENVSKAALWSFAALLAGLIAAALGGRTGAPKERVGATFRAAKAA